MIIFARKVILKGGPKHRKVAVFLSRGQWKVETRMRYKRRCKKVSLAEHVSSYSTSKTYSVCGISESLSLPALNIIPI